MDAILRVRCDASFAAAVRRCADEQRATVSDVTRWALLMYLERYHLPYRPPLDTTPPACRPPAPSDGGLPP